MRQVGDPARVALCMSMYLHPIDGLCCCHHHTVRDALLSCTGSHGRCQGMHVGLLALCCLVHVDSTW
jgi:hypothetical protein